MTGVTLSDEARHGCIEVLGKMATTLGNYKGAERVNDVFGSCVSTQEVSHVTKWLTQGASLGDDLGALADWAEKVLQIARQDGAFLGLVGKAVPVEGSHNGSVLALLQTLVGTHQYYVAEQQAGAIPAWIQRVEQIIYLLEPYEALPHRITREYVERSYESSFQDLMQRYQSSILRLIELGAD
jgi:hypothetical protein